MILCGQLFHGEHRHALDEIHTPETLRRQCSLGGATRGAVNLSLHPVHFRGMAYLAAYRGSEAAAEFQKILDHHRIVWNSPGRFRALVPQDRANCPRRKFG